MTFTPTIFSLLVSQLLDRTTLSFIIIQLFCLLQIVGRSQGLDTIKNHATDKKKTQKSKQRKDFEKKCFNRQNNGLERSLFVGHFPVFAVI